MGKRNSVRNAVKIGRNAGAAVWGLAAFLLLSAPSLRADDAAAPSRAARLSSVDGRVQISQGGQMIADPALANTPLFEGTQVVTTDDGRAEIQFEDGSVARLSPNSSLTLSVLRPDDTAAEIAMDGGLGYFELQGHIVVHFGDSAVTASGFSVLRVNLDNPPGELAVFSGNAHLDRGSALALDLHGGESVALNADPAQYNLSESIEPDSWDSWNSDRDQVLTSEAASKTSATAGFVNNANPAWNDLDANGNWYNVPGQGNVWSPFDAGSPGWDPYGNGYWMFNPRFGYMWVSGDSWGYMPFSCGMWSFYSGFGWGWAPGFGACSPWWGTGFYVTNIGYGPGGCLPPMRPHRPVHGNPGRSNKAAPYPLIAVNKRPPSGFGGQQPRARSGPVTIAGHVVEPLKPLSPRPVYDRSASSFVNHALPPGASGKTPGGPAMHVAGPGAHPVGVPGYRPFGGAPHAPPPSHSYSGGGGSAPSHAPSGGGGGGGGSHPSGGGGGSHH